MVLSLLISPDKIFLLSNIWISMACGPLKKKTHSWTHSYSGAVQTRLKFAEFNLPHAFQPAQLLPLQLLSFIPTQQPKMPTSFSWGSLHPWCAWETWSPSRSWFSSGSRAARRAWGTRRAWLVATGVVIIGNLIQHLIESVHLTYK